MENWINILGWLLSVATAIGNTFVVFLVAKNRRLHSSANWLVLSLAVADFGVGVVVFPLSYSCNYLMECNSRIYIAFYWFFLHSSVANLCTLTWDRYNAIVYPFKYNDSITKMRHGIVILAAWLIPFVISLSLFVGMYATDSETGLKVLRITGVSGFNGISCVLLFFAVVRILVVARAQSHRASVIELQIQANPSTMERANSRRRAFKTKQNNKGAFIVALVVFFLGCYAVVNSLIFLITFARHVSDRVFQVVSCLLVLNSAVNPLVYAPLKRDIKREISLVICRGKSKRKRSLSSELRSESYRLSVLEGH